MSSRPTLIHNPSCSKSREALKVLNARGVTFEVLRYLDAPLDAAAIRELARKVGGPPSRLLRRKEPEYAQLGLSDQSSIDEVCAAIVGHPRLLERPILVVGDRAVVGRPLEAFDALIGPVPGE